MKVIRNSPEGLCLRLGSREKAFFLHVLGRYPVMISQPLSRGSEVPDPQENQKLLEEALAEHRAENKQRLQKWLEQPGRFTRHDHAWDISLSMAEVEWLLQLLNDVRVGSWVMLGSPEEGMEVCTEASAPHLLSMQMAGAFEGLLLEALRSGGSL